MSTPVGIQRKRTKGWRMPPNTAYVGRPTVFGNHFDKGSNRKRSVQLYRHFIRRRWLELRNAGCTMVDIVKLQAAHKGLMDHIGELRGKNLACWCPLDQPCHRDVLLEIAND